ncbi:MAG TPA: DUF6502 family protein [Gammaproteobacteria bacterium]|nr:DUF6502 family protein [Gammaproteobacteria bacterium]
MTKHTEPAYAPTILPRGLIVLVLKTLRPLARMLLRHGMSCLEFEEISRWVFVDVSLRESEFALPNRQRPFKSRAAILTGLSRKEVMRLAQLPPPDERAAIPSRNRALRVVAGWMTHNSFVDEDGQPRELPLNKGANSFAELVRLYSGDVPHRAILDELVQNGLVEKLSNGKLRLLAETDEHAQLDETLTQAGVSLGGLLETLERNQHVGAEQAFPQQCLDGVRVPENRLPTVRDFIRNESEAFSRRVGDYLKDHAASGDAHATPHTVGIGVYYFED